MRAFILGSICAASCARPAAAPPPPPPRTATPDTAVVRRELERWYDDKRAFLAKDVDAIIVLRAEDFHSVTPDGAVHGRAEMELYTRGLLNGIDRWLAQNFELDSLDVSGDLAQATVHQHLDRLALRADGRIHHVETWVTQRETWRRTAQGWRLYRVDRIRDQRRLIDGEASPQARLTTYALTGVRVLDVGTAQYSARSVVLVTGDRITQIVQEDAFRPELADSAIDLSGLVLLPGLIDAHVHLALGGPMAANALATLRAGFTTVVDLGARSHRVLRFRDSVNAGLIPGPRILAAGLWVGIQGGVCEFGGIGVAGGPDAFRRRVRENVSAGADLIKLCVSGWPAEAFANPESYQLTDDVLSASVAEAHEARRRVVAHDLSRGGVAAALRARIDGLAHAAYVDSALATEMRRRDVFLIPTLASLASDSSAAARALVAAVGLAHRLGVPIVFGTDGGVLPHGGKAAEFAALRAAGVRPIDALRAATINAASALGLADSLGLIRAGMLADLIAVDGDVLADLGTLTQPRFVMARGRVIRR